MKSQSVEVIYNEMFPVPSAIESQQSSGPIVDSWGHYLERQMLGPI